MIIILRIMTQRAGVSFHNPIVQFLIRWTNPIINPLRRIIPAYRNIDFAALIVLCLIALIEIIVIAWVLIGKLPSILGMLVWLVSHLGSLTISILFYAIIINAILSWVPMVGPNPLRDLLFLITEPVVRIFRRFIPPISGFDLSPLAAIIVLKLIDIFIFQYLLNIAFRLSL
jgi:YggT family protein